MKNCLINLYLISNKIKMVHGTHNAIQDDRNNNIKIYVNGEFLERKMLK